MKLLGEWDIELPDDLSAIVSGGVQLIKLDVPNEVTAAAIEEGRKIAEDKNVKGYSSIKDLKAALDV